MKKIIYILFLAFLTPAAFAYEALTVDPATGKMPDRIKDKFIESNAIATKGEVDTKADASALDDYVLKTLFSDTLTDYALKSYVDAHFPLATLTRGTGLTGANYNGENAATWAVDTTWLVNTYHQTLTPQNGLQFTSGTTYNGQVSRYIQINTSWLDTNYANTLTRGTGLTGGNYNGKAAQTFAVDRAWVVDVVKDTAFTPETVQIYIDTTASVNPGDSTQYRTITIPFQNYTYDVFKGAETYPSASLAGASYEILSASNGAKSIKVNSGSITIPNSKNIGMKTNYSVFFNTTFANISALPVGTTIFSNMGDGSSTSQIGLRIYKKSSSYITAQYRATAGGTLVETNVNLSLFGNYNVNMGVVLNGSTMTFYRSGSSWGNSSITSISKEITATTSDIQLGGPGINGITFGDFRIFNGKALSSTEISALYQGNPVSEATVWLNNYFDLSAKTWSNLYNKQALNLTSGWQNAASTSYSYNVPKTTEWTDAEFKVLDQYDNLIYWVSTQRGAQMNADYSTHAAADLNAKIWYTCPDYYEGRRWIQYTWSTSYPTIYAHARMMSGNSTPTIGGIIIQPNITGNTVGGRSIAAIFGTKQSNTPNNYSYVYLRCSPTNFERTLNYSPIWRPYNALSTFTQKAR